MSKAEKIALIAEMLGKGKTNEQIKTHIDQKTDWDLSAKTIENYIADAKKLKPEGKAEPGKPEESENEENKPTVITKENLAEHLPILEGESSSQYEQRVFAALNLKRDSEAQTIFEKYPWISESYVEQKEVNEEEAETGAGENQFIEGETEQGKRAAKSIDKAKKKEEKAAKKAAKKAKQQEAEQSGKAVKDLSSSKRKKKDRLTSKYHNGTIEGAEDGDEDFEFTDEQDKENIAAVLGNAETLKESLQKAIDYRKNRGGYSSVTRLIGAQRAIEGLRKALD